MSFCPRCGAPTTASMSFCTSCGESLAPGMMSTAPPPSAAGTAPAPVAPVAPAAPPALAPRGPVGRVQEPWLPLVLTLVTFGIYGFFYWWRVSKEVDAYRMTPGHANKPILIGAILGAVVAVVFIIIWVSAISAFFASGFTEDTPPTEAQMAGMFGAFALFPLAILGGMVAYVFWLVGQWRVWSVIEAEERARNHPKPLSPGLQLVFVLVPYLNIVTFWVALYRTQDRLNGVWTGRVTSP